MIGRERVAAIVAAGGSGARAGAPKQWLALGGESVLRRSSRLLADCAAVDEVIAVVPAGDVGRGEADLAGLAKPVRVVAGGERRADSVRNGLDAAEGCAVVLVHDAARPFVSADVIDRVLAVAALGAAAVPGVPLADTVKETDTAGLVVRTVPRERLVGVQTPQAFPRAMLETAHQRARGDGPAATDDATLCERLGHPVRVVAGSAWNIKITTPEDFALAEALAGAERIP